MPPWRRQTGDADAPDEPRRRLTQPFTGDDPEPSVVQDHFSAYEDFPWEKIESYLLKLFPDFTDHRRVRCGDQWAFQIPRALTEVERSELTRRRDDYVAEIRDKQNGNGDDQNRDGAVTPE